MNARRREHPANAAASDSRAICEKLQGMTQVREAGIVMAYAPIRNEVDLTPLWQELWKKGHTIVLPRVEGEHLAAVAYTGPDGVRSGVFGIHEPVGSPIPADKIDAVLVPGLVFDLNGYRLGYGKGYYDRFLPLLRPDVAKIGIAYSFQVVADVQPTPTDVRLDFLVTEKEIIQPDPA